LAGDFDAFVIKLSPQGTILASTYFGGGNSETGVSVASDSNGNVVLVGRTFSTDFPTKNSIQSTNAGSTDAFVFKFDSTLSNLVFSTYYGGSAGDGARDVALDGAGSPIIYGFTVSTNLSVTNAFQPQPGGERDAFVFKLSADGKSFIYASYLGGRGDESSPQAFGIYDGDEQINVDIADLMVDDDGAAYLTGQSQSSDFPLAAELLGTSSNRDQQAFVVKVSPDGKSLLFSTFLHSTAYDFGTGMALDRDGNLFVSGQMLWNRNPPVFPTTPGAFQKEYQGGELDGYIVALSPQARPPVNDNFINRTLLTGTRFTVLGDITQAGSEPNEPGHAGSPASHSLWWDWTAPLNGQLTVSTTGNELDTRLALYTGSTLETLVPVISNDDGPFDAGSSLVLDVNQGQRFSVAVDGNTGATGATLLSFFLSVPANDHFTNRIMLNQLPFTNLTSNTHATSEIDDPGGYISGRSIWWSWTAPTSTVVRVKVSSPDFQPVLTLYTNDTLATLQRLDTTYNEAKIAFHAVQGITYQISVDGLFGASGPLELSITPATPPANDDLPTASA